MESISRKIQKCNLNNVQKDKFTKKIENALILRQKVGNTIVKLEEKF